MDSVEVLEKNLKIASQFTPMLEEEKRGLLAGSQPYALDGRYEHYKLK